MRFEKYLIENIVIGYDKAKKLGIDKDIEALYLKMPLPKSELTDNIKQWKKDRSQLVLMGARYKEEIAALKNKIS